MKKIVIIGPESTGKSTLSGQLADYYKTIWVPEYAREFLHTHGRNYTYEDLLTIAKGQISLEEKYFSFSGDGPTGNRKSNQQPPGKNKLLFIDTDMYVMKVWCEFVFNRCHHWIINAIVERSYDLYLLCNIDLPWVNDELREYPDIETRKKLFNMYKDILINQSTPWTEISGNYQMRLKTAIHEVDRLGFS